MGIAVRRGAEWPPWWCWYVTGAVRLFLFGTFLTGAPPVTETFPATAPCWHGIEGFRRGLRGRWIPQRTQRPRPGAHENLRGAACITAGVPQWPGGHGCDGRPGPGGGV